MRRTASTLVLLSLGTLLLFSQQIVVIKKKSAGGSGNVDVFITSSADDGNDYNGTFDAAVSYSGHYSGSDITDGLRFLNVTIPQGATITSATLTILQYEVPVGTITNVHMRVYGSKTANAAAFGSGNFPSAMTKTTAYVDLDPTSWTVTAETNINVASIVGEIVGQGTWSSGNAMAFGIFNDGTTGDNFVRFIDYADGSQYAAELAVSYTY